MPLPAVSKARKIISLLLTFWIPFKKYRHALRGILQFGICNYIKTIRYEKNTKFEHEIVVGAIMKDEGPYLKEWLDYHILVGINKFYLYDNESTDNTKEILKPYIKSGIVEYHYIPGKSKQYDAYKEILEQHSYDSRYITFIDLDEFLVPVQHNSIQDFLNTLPKNFTLLVISWVLYGSSSHIKKPNGLVIENYTQHRKQPSGVKSIVNPRLIVFPRIHIHHVAGFVIDENGKKLGRINQTKNPPSTNKIRLNHYITKSKEEFEKRINRGGGVHASNSDYIKKKRERFVWYNQDTVTDNIMDKYVKQLKS